MINFKLLAVLLCLLSLRYCEEITPKASQAREAPQDAAKASEATIIKPPIDIVIGIPDSTGSVQRPANKQSFKLQDITTTYSLIQNVQTQSQTSNVQLAAPLNVDLYSLANSVFNSQDYFPFCDRCKTLQYLAFRTGSYYLTAYSTYLQLAYATSPNNSQLFIAEQQIDGTWAFRSLTNGRYIRASNDGVTINYQTFVGPWQRWYIQRHGDHCHIQSAQWEYNWWVFDNYRLEQFNGGASAVIVEYWPSLQWLWNW